MFDLRPDLLAIVSAVLKEHVPDREVRAFGSRVSWTAKEHSDLDLVIRGEKRLTLKKLAAIKEAFEESELPIRVDVLDWHGISESFRKVIEKGYEVIQKGKREEGEWREIRLGDLVDSGALLISDGYRVRNDELGPEGIPFVRGGDIGDGWINTNTADHIRPEFTDRIQSKLTQPDDAAFIAKGTVGRAGRLRPEQPSVVFAPQVAYWRALDRSILDPGFIFYLIRSHEFQSSLNGVKTHGAMVADYVSISQQYDFRFRFPSIDKQRAIAHILGTLDDKIELNRRMNETLEAMARALFKSWFVDFDPVRAKAEGRDTGLPEHIAELFPDRFVDSDLGEIPEGWEAQPLPQAIEVNPPRLLRKGQIAPYLDMANMPTRGHTPDEVVDRGNGSGTRFINGDTLLARITPCLENGKTAFVDFLNEGQVGWGSTEYIVLRPKPPLPEGICVLLGAGQPVSRIRHSKHDRVERAPASASRVPRPLQTCYTAEALGSPVRLLRQTAIRG